MKQNLAKLRKSIQKAPSEPGVYPVRSHGSVRIPKKGKLDFNLLPTSNGIYFFKDKKGFTLYIGKAANLKARLKQYLNGKSGGPFISHLLNEAVKVDFKKTESEIEALILESQLIKKERPKYNIMLRDDKKYFYVGITKEEFPRIFLTHQPTVVSRQKPIASSSISQNKIDPLLAIPYSLPTNFIGPFTNGSTLKTTLRFLRKIFPYCTCKQKHNNFCLNYHIGKCLGFCCLKNPELRIMNYELRSYKRNIRAIRDILTGKRETLIKNLKKELAGLSKKEEFEKAIDLRDKIEKLERVFENAQIIQHDANIRMHTKVLYELKKIFKLPKLPRRIEGYDISNIQGTNATGSMVVFTRSTSSGQANYQPDKNEYRKFKIRTKTTPDDIAMLKEVLTRRFNHPEWQYPDLILIDGGRAQLNIAIETLKRLNIEIPVISLSKGKQEKVLLNAKAKSASGRPMAQLPPEIGNLIKQIDTEAHRFAIGYYRKLHRKRLTPKFTP